MLGPVPLIGSERIERRIAELAVEIDRYYAARGILAVGVLKGSYVFLADLCRKLAHEVEVDFIQTSSYGFGTSSSGVVKITKDLDVSIEGRDVLIVEDIVDTGQTLRHLLDLLATRNPASLRVVSLLSKPSAREVPAPVDWTGFEIADQFVVGYGLDLAERYRNLPYIALLPSDMA